MQVKGINGNGNWLMLPRLYARKNLTVDKEEISIPEKMTEWEYLRSVTKEIIQNDNVCIGLLIGANCMKALEPMQVIASENGSPYACRTRLGWCIVGPIMNGDNKDSISCHRVADRDLSTSQMSLHHFGIKDSIKDVTLEEMFKMIYKNDFSEPSRSNSSRIMVSSNEVSVENRKVLYILEKETVKKDDHYVVPLPFRDENLVMPNNRIQALRRLKCLKRRLLEDERFFKDYKKFMNDLLIKGYAKRSDMSPMGKIWYIPHHGVYHTNKPRKIRVVFDCSTEFEVRSINQELLSGPDLTNQIDVF